MTNGCTVTYSRGCLQGTCRYSSGLQKSNRWAALKFAWHTLFCRWARWPEHKSLPPAPRRFYVSDPKGQDEETP
jgi:hypothetical protein